MRPLPTPQLRVRNARRRISGATGAATAISRVLPAPLHPEILPDVPTPRVLAPDEIRLQADIAAILDRAAAGEAAARTGAAIDALRAIREAAGEGAWPEVALGTVRAHPLAELLWSCPLTAHAYRRPRGYPGDAGLLDLIYRHPDAAEAVAAAGDIGRAVYAVTRDSAPCRSVRERREILARTIDRVAEERPGAEMLAVACGHLREAEISAALGAGRVARFLATDQDAESLRVVADRARTLPPAIACRPRSVRDFIAAREDLGRFDLIYAAGLYDYLDDRIAARLTRRLFALLKPGGRLVVANFLPGLGEQGYMEAFMDWWLIYRTEAAIRGFAGEISENDIRAARYFPDEAGCVGYLELERA
ncbi:class I SAM-dependent methyltransferase [Methylobacterium dankookense]|uniref:Methyltransferase domain-containing protein n=1 Tax=Methylobacterium dankookense TaxID=560405 RepID=A0A564G4T7_9HYPH|nr:class I SAM-dependent methyltransferase [Methylobacterium dankookense]GJD58787.1 hypothetical protein IFDJLNFL_4711 [Methylobacterium dankookense]VUF15509.1 hypothetical protein MTDSW087_05250 [Methylobacterium dankookense]